MNATLDLVVMALSEYRIVFVSRFSLTWYGGFVFGAASRKRCSNLYALVTLPILLVVSKFLYIRSMINQTARTSYTPNVEHRHMHATTISFTGNSLRHSTPNGLFVDSDCNLWLYCRYGWKQACRMSASPAHTALPHSTHLVRTLW